MKTSNKLGLDCFALYNPLYKFWVFFVFQHLAFWNGFTEFLLWKYWRNKQSWYFEILRNGHLKRCSFITKRKNLTDQILKTSHLDGIFKMDSVVNCMHVASFFNVVICYQIKKSLKMIRDWRFFLSNKRILKSKAQFLDFFLVFTR